MTRDFRHDTESEPNMRAPSPVSDLVERLNGENPDKVVATDRLRIYAHDPDTFEFDQHDALSLIPVIEEAAYTLTTLSTRNAELERGIDRLAAYIMENVPGEPSENQGAVDAAIRLLGKNAALEREVKRLREVIQPFADVADHDIGDDEADRDVFRPMTNHNSAAKITVGDMRAVLAALSTSPQGGEHGQR